MQTPGARGARIDLHDRFLALSLIAAGEPHRTAEVADDLDFASVAKKIGGFADIILDTRRARENHLALIGLHART